MTLVRPQLEYALPPVWSPNTDQDINKLEAAQRIAARWATRDYKQLSSVTEMPLATTNNCPVLQKCSETSAGAH